MAYYFNKDLWVNAIANARTYESVSRATADKFVTMEQLTDILVEAINNKKKQKKRIR